MPKEEARRSKKDCRRLLVLGRLGWPSAVMIRVDMMLLYGLGTPPGPDCRSLLSPYGAESLNKSEASALFFWRKSSGTVSQARAKTGP